MIEFGLTLRTAREAKGLSISQIAEKTHMMSSMVEDLENERFSRIVAPIYGRGFVKLYCNAVGLDPKPLVDEFMDIYNGNRPPTIREREGAPRQTPVTIPEPVEVPESVPEPQEETVEPETETTEYAAPVGTESQPEAAEDPHSYQDDLFDAPKTLTLPKPTFHTIENETPAKLEKKPVKFSHYSAPISSIDSFPELAPMILRWAMLTAVVGLLLWALVAGIGALYKATSREAAAPEQTSTNLEIFEDNSTTRPQAEQPQAKPVEQPQLGAPRTPLAIPPLYID